MIILTGASGGLGQAIRKSLKEINIGNNSIIPIYHKNKGDIEFGEQRDLADLQDIKWLARIALAGTPPLKITLIHLAALKIDNLALNVTEEEWDKVMAVNLKGAFFFTKALIPKMMEEKWGRIIFVTSSGIGDIGTFTYTIAKYGVCGMSKVLSKEYAKYNITSNVVKLGYYQTGMWNKLSEEKKKELLGSIPSKKLGNPQNIVNAIKMLIDSDYINGAEIKVDGGI